MDTIQVTDLYQASYLLVNGCALEGVECIPVSGSLACRITFSGQRLDELQDDYFTKRASVNVWAFRSAYNQINSYVHQAKKSYEHAKRSSVRSREEGGAV